MKKRIVPMLLTALAVSSCTSDKLPAGSVAIDVENFAPVTDFFDDYRFVMLETSESVKFGKNSVIKLTEDYSRIVSYSEQTGFSVFDKDGRWIKSFEHHGRGPNEYLNVTNFFLHDSSIYAVDGFQSKILVYAMDTGKCDTIISIGDNYTNAAWLGDKHIALCAAYNSSDRYNLALLNVETGKIEKKFLPYKNPDSATYSEYDSFVGRGKDGLYVSLPFSTTLYHLTADTCTVAEKYFFNAKDQFEEINIEDINLREMEERTRMKRCVKWLRYFSQPSENQCYQSFELLTDQGILPFLCKYNPVTKESKTLCIGSEKFDEFPYLMTSPIQMDDNYYISFSLAERLLSHEDIYGDSTFSDKGLTYESSPVIFFHHLKQTW